MRVEMSAEMTSGRFKRPLAKVKKKRLLDEQEDGER